MKKSDVRNLFATISLSALLLGSVGCTKNEDFTNSGGTNSNLPVFDFSTKSNYVLNVNYAVPKGYSVYFEVYAENPLTVDENGQQIKKAGVEPLDKGYTDQNGAYSDRLMVPSYVQTVYIYTPNAGVTQLLEAKVENGVLLPATLPSHSNIAAVAGTRAVTNIETDKTSFNPFITVKTLGTWLNCVSGYTEFPNVSESILPNKQAKLFGRPTYLKYVDQTLYPGVGEPAKDISADVWNTINSVLTGVDKTQDQFDVLDNGDIKIFEESEVDINFLSDAGLYMNGLAYYCYDTNTPPTYASNIKVQVIAFPNAKTIGVHYPALDGSIFDFGAMRPGEGIRLRYIDQKGVDHGTKFPAGVSIGWILCSDGYSRIRGTAGTGRSPIYSNPALNNGLAHTALFRHNDFVVLAFEDAAKQTITDARDYDDVIFSVSATKSSAITPGIPDKNPDPKPEEDGVATETTYRGMLLFEDIWPYRGDFDMNDVVIKYVSKVGYDKNNRVVRTIEEYTPMWSGARLNNSFAYQNPNLGFVQTTITFDGGDGAAAVDVNDKTIIRLADRVLDYANQTEKKTFTVTTKYQTPITKRDFVMPPYNPFIVVDGKQTHEVHLTNMKPTSYADVSLLGKGHDLSSVEKNIYYVTYNEQSEQMPFGIDITFDNDDKMNAFVIPKERECINVYYSGFMGWILSGGKTNQDWYLNPKQ